MNTITETKTKGENKMTTLADKITERLRNKIANINYTLKDVSESEKLHYLRERMMFTKMLLQFKG